MPRGRRPGAGAPIGNFNGLRTGLHSPRVLAAINTPVTDPVLWQALRRLSAEPEFAGRKARAAGQRQMRKNWRKQSNQRNTRRQLPKAELSPMFSKTNQTSSRPPKGQIQAPAKEVTQEG